MTQFNIGDKVTYGSLVHVGIVIGVNDNEVNNVAVKWLDDDDLSIENDYDIEPYIEPKAVPVLPKKFGSYDLIENKYLVNAINGLIDCVAYLMTEESKSIKNINERLGRIEAKEGKLSKLQAQDIATQLNAIRRRLDDLEATNDN